MSLLLDALKRAEQEKRARAAAEAAPERPAQRPTLELAPVAAKESMPPPSRPSAGSPPPPSVTPRIASRPRRPALWAALAFALLACAAGGAYIWYSITALAPKIAVKPPGVRNLPPPAPRPAPLPLPEKPSASAASVVTSAPTPRRPSVAAPAPEAAPAAAHAAPLLQPAASERARVPADVAGGYEALRTGDLENARRRYAAAHSSEPTNLDATLGLATVEARSNRREAAALLYRHALEIDPRNATALAGLAALSDTARAEGLEAELAREAAQHPASAPLQFTLGNLHASRDRWMEAQAAYFEAHRLDPSSPEIAHNLAVSLDRLGQPRLAAGFYRRALEAARTRASPIDSEAVERRLAEIDSR